MIRTPDQRLRVFVSSTLQELAAERAAAHEAISQLRLLPVMFELGARPHPPADLYRAYLEQSDIFVGLYWERYGWVAPDMEVSGLEDEWVLATAHPKLVYIKEPADGREPRLDVLIDRIREDNSTSYRSFHSPEELRDLLQNDLAVLLSERFESAQRSPADSTTARHGLPNPPSALLGRDVEVSALRELMGRDDCRMVTITGPGGSGKTRLAIELATRVRDEQGWAAAFADLTVLRSSSLVLPTIAAALGVKDPGERTLVDAVAGMVADEPSLIVVDNFEHVMDTASELADLLEATGSLRVLVTSRQPLRLRWEHEFPLPPLAAPDPAEQTSVDAVAVSPAVELLVERIQRVRPGFVLDEGNVAAVAEIARRLDGLPLALELAAARMRVLAPADLLARLEHRLDAVVGSSPDRPSRHRTLRATITWSHDHLTDDEKRVFRRMGVFSGGATIEELEAVCAGDDIDPALVLEVAEGLVDKSLLVSSLDAGDMGGATRVTMLETVREFAVEQLVAAGEAVATWDRHLTWFLAFVERAWEGYWTSEMPAWLGRLERDYDNIRSALDHAAGAGDPVLGLRIGSAMWFYWDVRGQYREGERRLRELLRRAPTTPSAERGRALVAQGWLTALLGDFETARDLMEEGVAQVRTHGTELQLAWSLAELGNVTFSLGDAETTEALFSESLERARALDQSFLTGLGLFGLGYVALLHGDLDTMDQRLRQSLELSRSTYQPWAVAWAQFSLGIVSIMRGDTLAAVPPITESLELRWSIRDARGLSESVQILATLASAHGDNDWSALLHGAAELQREANGLTILPFLRPLHDESLARLRAALDERELDELWRVGRSMPLEKLVPEALARAGA